MRLTTGESAVLPDAHGRPVIDNAGVQDRKVGRGWWLSPLVALVVANVVVFGWIVVGLGQTGSRSISAFAGDAHLDYGLGPLRGFMRLTDDFVAGVLGPTTDLPGGSSSSSKAASSATARGGRAGHHAGPTSRVTVSHSFTNDDFDHAYVVPSVPFTARTDTRGATREVGEPGDCAPTGGTAWYRYAATGAMTLLADTFGSSYATTLGVFTGSGLGRLHSLGCNTSATGNAQLGFPVEADTTYYFQITGPLGGGTLMFGLARIGRTDRASLSASGGNSNGASSAPSLSADGRYVAFASAATDLVANQRLGCAKCTQIFVRDHATGLTSLESVSTTGEPGDLDSGAPVLSEGGRYLAFWSQATNLVAGPTGPTGPIAQVYVRDRLRNANELVSVSSAGIPGDGDSTDPSISADGRHIVFASHASNFRPNGGIPCGSACVSQQGTPTGSQLQIYVHDRLTGTTTLVSAPASGAPPDDAAEFGAISADGRFAAFATLARNIVGTQSNSPQVYERDLASGKVTLISRSTSGAVGNRGSLYQMTLSRDGRYVAFLSDATNLVPGDTNDALDVFVHDRVTGTTTRVSVTSSGEQAKTPSDATAGICHCNSSDVLTQVSPSAAISADGRFVAFSSLSPNLVDNDTNGVSDVFVHDLVTGATTRVSVASDGTQGNGPSTAPTISADGSTIAFASSATDLVADDTNGFDDVFTHENELAQ